MPCCGEMLHSAAAVAVTQRSTRDAGMEVLQRLEARLGVLSSERKVVNQQASAQTAFAGGHRPSTLQSSSYRGRRQLTGGRSRASVHGCYRLACQACCGGTDQAFSVLTPACQMACRLRCMGTKAAGPPWLLQNASRWLQPVGPIGADCN